MNKFSFSQSALLDHLPIAAILLNNTGKILWRNKLAVKILHLNKKYTAINDIFSNFEIKKHLKNKKNSMTTLRHYPNTFISLSIIPYKKASFLVFAQDYTHLYHLERVRQDFVANVSHELRTPLTVIHGYLEILTKNNFSMKYFSEKIFPQMYQQTIRMQKLIEDLLLLSRLETEFVIKDNFKVVDVANILNRIAKDTQLLFTKKHQQIHFSVDENLKIYGLENELYSAFINLITNASHYTAKQGKVWVKWFCEKKHAVLQVRDTGIGIAAEHIPRLTERFYRVDGARSQASGTGLGLAIVKHALLHHQAQLKIVSKLNSGSTFTCVFPSKLIVKKS